MAKTIDINSGAWGRRRRTYSDVEFVAGLLDDRKVQEALYRHWERYFNDHVDAEFYHLDENRTQIIHNAYEVLWRNVRYKRIYVENGILIGKGGKPFTSSLTTYLMGIAKNNNKEIVRDVTKMPHIEDFRSHGHKVDCDDDGMSVESNVPSEPVQEGPFLIPSAELVMREIVAEIIANMSERCSQILTLFYYKEMKLDSIMEQLPSFSSKDALKTAKNKCMDRLKTVARKQYKDYLNS